MAFLQLNDCFRPEADLAAMIHKETKRRAHLRLPRTEDHCCVDRPLARSACSIDIVRQACRMRIRVGAGIQWAKAYDPACKT